jgi:ribonuclease HII
VANLEFETAVREQSGFIHIAGLDEAGRGAIAGPVVAAAVILPLLAPERLKLLSAVNDSKQLSAKKRETLYDLIIEHALAYGIGRIAAEAIDQVGIIPANVQAMQQALKQLEPAADYLLIDGRMRLKNVPLPQQSIIKGDQKSLSIAAASILAKVSRDREMVALDGQYPGYGLARHKGYCTRDHEMAVEQYGPSPIHRHTFAPIRRPFL